VVLPKKGGCFSIRSRVTVDFCPLDESMKHFSILFFAFLFPMFVSAYEGVLEYKIVSGDRDWKMVCSVKDEMVRAEIYLGTSHFQTILQNEEGLLLIDELNKQVFQADYEREKWGKPGELEYKDDMKGDYSDVGPFNRDGVQGEIYSIRSKGKDNFIEIASGLGSMPGIFLDQFSSLSGLYDDGRILFKEHPGMPVRIYRKKQESKPILQLVKQSAQSIDPSVFVVSEGYVRAKMRFKMR